MSSSVDDLSGTTLGGRFQLERQLGRGGMGAVYLAKDLSKTDGVPVALKIIKDSLVDDVEAIKRFQREAVSVGKLEHPRIVRLLGSGDLAGIHWMAMEFLEGKTLRERIAESGAIPWRVSLGIVEQILDGLVAAHGAGVVHRDLKPDNVMLEGSDTAPLVKLLDFGVAKQMDAEAMTMTGTGLIVGTPGFIAPEVIVHGISNDPRSDLYALGVVWFEMVTATQPFSATTPFALAMKHAQELPPSPNAVRPFSPVPEPIEGLILQLLAKSPEQRPPSALALHQYVLRLIEQADHPEEPSNSMVRTERDLAGGDATETGFGIHPEWATGVSGKTMPLWAALGTPTSSPPSSPVSLSPSPMGTAQVGTPATPHIGVMSPGATLPPSALVPVEDDAEMSAVVVVAPPPPVQLPSHDGAAPNRAPMVLAGLALVGVVVLAAWMVLRTPPAVPVPVPVQPPPVDVVLEPTPLPAIVDVVDAGSLSGGDADAGVEAAPKKPPPKKPPGEDPNHKPQLLLDL